MAYGAEQAGDPSAHGAFAEALHFVLNTPDSIMSIGSLSAAFLIAAAWVAWRFRYSRQRLSLRRLATLVFPARYIWTKSHLLDLWLMLLNLKLLGLVAVWLVISSHTLGVGTNALLATVFGAPGEPPLPGWAAVLISTVVLYLAYELGYWINHYLSHRISWVWEFHRVHHEATTLTPLTAFRVHPVDSLFFANVMGVVTGPVQGILAFGLGQSASEMTLLGYNAVLLVLSYLLVQLQHSHVWLPTTGWLGRLVLSPAHHQIHHSTDPAHYGSNLGSCLAIFDWMFGTLRVPDARRQKLTFGVPDETGADPHTLRHGLLGPFARVASGLGQIIRRPRALPPEWQARTEPG